MFQISALTKDTHFHKRLQYVPIKTEYVTFLNINNTIFKHRPIWFGKHFHYFIIKNIFERM